MKVDRNIRGIDIEGSVKEMMRSLSQYDPTGRSRIPEALAGRGARVVKEEIPEMLARAAAHAQAPTGKMFANVTKGLLSTQNMLGSLGAGILKHHKAIGLGFAGSLALSAVLSAPSDTIGPGNALIPSAKMNVTKGASRMSPDTMMPPQHNLGTPGTPNLMQNQTTRIMPNRGRTVHIRARAPASANVSALSGTLPRVAGISGATSVNLYDSRSEMNMYTIGNKLL